MRKIFKRNNNSMTNQLIKNKLYFPLTENLILNSISDLHYFIKNKN